LDIAQEQARRRPLPDGTIPSSGAILEGQTKGQDTFAKRPIPEPPKEPLVEENSDYHGHDEGLKPKASKASTIPIPSADGLNRQLGAKEARELQREYEDQIPSHADDVQNPQASQKFSKLSEGHDRDVFYTRSAEKKPEFSSLPRSRIPKHTEDKQESEEHVKDGQLNQDVYYSTPEPGQEASQTENIPHKAAIPEQDQVPEGVNTDVFRTKRVAEMLGGNPYKSKPSLNLKGARGTPYDHTPLASGKDQDTFNVRTSQQDQPTTPEQPLGKNTASEEKEMRDFASRIADDIKAAAAPAPEVRLLPIEYRAHC
jgi:aarF domain-containing kinase